MFRIALLAFLCSVPGVSGAICKMVPVEKQFRGSENVFIATITAATAAKDVDFANLKSGDRYKIEYSFVVAESFKGNPSAVKVLHSYASYDDPKDDIEIHAAESFKFVPGDSILLFAGKGPSVAIGFCSVFELEPNRHVKELRRLARAP